MAEEGGFRDIGTLAGTKGTVLTPKYGRLPDVERADGGCSGLADRDDLPTTTERVG